MKIFKQNKNQLPNAASHLSSNRLSDFKLPKMLSIDWIDMYRGQFGDWKLDSLIVFSDPSFSLSPFRSLLLSASLNSR